MHSERQRAVLYLIPEGKFHFIAVAEADRARPDSFKTVFFLSAQHGIQQSFYLCFLDLKLLLIRKGEINTAAADAKMRTGAVCFLRRTPDDFQKPSFRLSFSDLIDRTSDPLPRQSIFYHTNALFRFHDSFVWKIYPRNDAFQNLSFFHPDNHTFLTVCDIT